MEVDKAFAQASLVLQQCGSTAREAKALFTRLVLRHGMPFVRNLSALIAKILQNLHRRTRSWFGAIASCQQIERVARLVETLLRKVLASVVVCLNSNALNAAAKQLISVSMSQECGQGGLHKLNGPKESRVTCNLRLFGGLIWLQVGVKKPRLSKGASSSSSSGSSSATFSRNDASTVNTEQPDGAQVPEHCSTSKAAEQPEKRVPLLTSSTESFKVGLKSYAQLHGPKHISIPSNGYPAAQDLSPVKKVRGTKATASTAQSAASFVVSAISADPGVDSMCWLEDQDEQDTCTSGMSCAHARPLIEISRSNTKALPAPLKPSLSPGLMPVDGAARILAANAVPLSPGQPTPDVAGMKKMSKGKKGSSGDSGSGGPADSTGSSGSSTKTSGRAQGISKENACPWR